MKLFIASDIHGSAYFCRKMIEAFKAEKADRMLLLGDILYHGPRNDLPQEYAPKEVIALLNSLKDKILCVRGNCDTEVDQMVLSFPVMADYCALLVDGHVIYATHGHVFNEGNPPPLQPGDVLLSGHTHVPRCHRREGLAFVNPGSVSIPKQNTPHSYAILEDGVMTWKDLQGGAFMREALWPAGSD